MLAHTVHKLSKLMCQQLKLHHLAQVRKPLQRPKKQITLALPNAFESVVSDAISGSSVTCLVGLSEKITAIRSGSPENEHLKRTRHGLAPARRHTVPWACKCGCSQAYRTRLPLDQRRC